MFEIVPAKTRPPEPYAVHRGCFPISGRLGNAKLDARAYVAASRRGGKALYEILTVVDAIPLPIPSNKNARSPQRETGNWPSDLNNVCPVAKSSLIRTAQTDHEIQADAQDSQD